MTKDVHQQRIGAIGAVQFFPPPISTKARSLRGSVNLFEAFAPLSTAADFLVRSRMEVSMSAIVVSPKDYAGDLPIRMFVQKSIHRRESEATETEFAQRTDITRKIEI